MQNVFPKFSETPGAVRSIAPQSIGEHNAEVLGGLLEMDQVGAVSPRTEGADRLGNS